MRRNPTSLSERSALMFAAVLTAVLVGAGCGKSAAPANNAGGTPAKKTSTSAASQTPAKVAGAPANAFLSVFATDSPRDPFHPQIKPKATAPTVISGPPIDAEAPQIIASIQGGFQGIFGLQSEREVMVHDVLLPENRERTVTVFVNGQVRKLKVKAVKIYRTAAELQIEGISQLVTVPKTR